MDFCPNISNLVSPPKLLQLEELSKLEKLSIEVKRSFSRSLRANFGFPP